MGKKVNSPFFPYNVTRARPTDVRPDRCIHVQELGTSAAGTYSLTYTIVLQTTIETCTSVKCLWTASSCNVWDKKNTPDNIRLCNNSLSTNVLYIHTRNDPRRFRDSGPVFETNRAKRNQMTKTPFAPSLIVFVIFGTFPRRLSSTSLLDD